MSGSLIGSVSSREEALENISKAIEEISKAEAVIQASKGRIMDVLSEITDSCKKDIDILGKNEICKKLRLSLIGSDGDEIFSVYDEGEIINLLNMSALCKSLCVGRSTLMDRISKVGVESAITDVIKDREIRVKIKNKPTSLQLYVQTLRKEDDEYLKVGIAQDTASRVAAQDKRSAFSHCVDHVFVGGSREVRDVEASIKMAFKRADIPRSWMPNGYTEVFEMKDREGILNIIKSASLEEMTNLS